MARVFHPIARTSQAHIRFLLDGKQCENVFSYQWNNTTPPSSAELYNLATELWSTLGVKIVALLNLSSLFTEVYCRNVDVEIAPQATYSIPGIVHGTRGGGNLPSQVAAIPIKRTGLTGRSHHGATRYSGFVDGDVTGNEIGSYIFNQLISIALSVLATRVGGRFIPALASRKLGYSTQLTQIAMPSLYVDSDKKRIPDA